MDTKGDGMKHRKSSQRQKPAERRERKKDPRDTPFPLPPTPISAALPIKPLDLYRLHAKAWGDAYIWSAIHRRTTCMMERETW